MKYILESSSFKYLLEELPRAIVPELWHQFEIECDNGNIISDKETKKLVEMELASSDSLMWMDKNKSIFKAINEKVADELGNMMRRGLFSYYENNTRLIDRKLPEGVPFILAMAKAQKDIFVYRKNGKDTSVIIDICQKENITYIELEDMLMQLKQKI